MDSVITQLNAILQKHSGTRTNGKVASERTKSAIGEALRADFRRLSTLGFKLQKPENLGEKHVEALCKSWYNDEFTVKTIQVKLSYLRIFCRWIGKGEMVKDAPHYLPDVPKAELKVTTAAASSKSWAANGVDIAEKVREADALDLRFGAMLRLAVAFGLRRHEVLECYPWKVDKVTYFAAYKTKGDRPRNIDIDTPEQRIVLDHVKSMVKKSEHLGWTAMRDGSAATIEYNLAKWHKMLAKIGITKAISKVTGHGLRAQYAENAALIVNVIPPTLGGTTGQMAKDDLDLKREQVSELLGHSRKSITSAYFGSFDRNSKPDAADRTKLAIEAAVAALPAEKITDIPPERMDDCMRLTTELTTVRAYVEPRITQALWEHHSSRHCTPWLRPGESNIAALEAAANHFAVPR
ncbi:phage integrase N-terminal domain-containing protein [Massilia aerilata]|uniref:Phage integrase N-terminal domain-containing protein n=1 Tax=Massilia aerilata TaxID=453817 RepID=A0ABW0S4R0_9BURK